MKLGFWIGGLAATLLQLSALAQVSNELLAQDEQYALVDSAYDPSPDLNAYEALNGALGGDSIRLCGGHPCIGWVEDQYAQGGLKHRGYYDNGRLTLYRNFHRNGTLEREFRSIDAVKSIMRTYFSGGQLRSEARFASGVSIAFEDHYQNGALRYAEERHRTEPYFLRMDLYSADGHPISLLQLVDKKRVEFEQKEYHPGGALKCQGRARYDPARMDTQRIGTWIYYEASGAVVAEEDYQDGRVTAVR